MNQPQALATDPSEVGRNETGERIRRAVTGVGHPRRHTVAVMPCGHDHRSSTMDLGVRHRFRCCGEQVVRRDLSEPHRGRDRRQRVPGLAWCRVGEDDRWVRGRLQRFDSTGMRGEPAAAFPVIIVAVVAAVKNLA